MSLFRCSQSLPEPLRRVYRFSQRQDVCQYRRRDHSQIPRSLALAFRTNRKNNCLTCSTRSFRSIVARPQYGPLLKTRYRSVDSVISSFTYPLVRVSRSGFHRATGSNVADGQPTAGPITIASSGALHMTDLVCAVRALSSNPAYAQMGHNES